MAIELTSKKFKPKYRLQVAVTLLTMSLINLTLSLLQHSRLGLWGSTENIEYDAHVPQTSKTTGSDREEALSFPQWSDPRGLDFSSIQAYLEYSLLPENVEDREYNVLFPTKLFPNQFPSPNVLYAFGMNGAVWRDHFTWEPVKKFLKNDRYRPFERLLQDSLKFLKSPGFNTSAMARLHELTQIGSKGIPILANLDDNRRCADGNLFHNCTIYSVPIFNLAVANPSTNYCKAAFPVPTYSTMTLVREIEDAEQQVRKNATTSSHSKWMHFREQDANFPWESKIPTVIWRGTSSGLPPLSSRHRKYNGNDTDHPHRYNVGGIFNPQIADTYPIRLQAVRTAYIETESHEGSASKQANVSSLHTPLLDIHFYNSRYSKIFPELKRGELIKPSNKFQSFKAVLDVDGNSWSERFARLLCMNSVVIKVEPEFVDYFWPTVKPWVHYVPVAQDSSNLWNISSYVMDPTNDKEMRQIVQNAREWCQENLKYDRLMGHMLDSLSYYLNELDRHDPYWYETWKHIYQDQVRSRVWQPLK